MRSLKNKLHLVEEFVETEPNLQALCFSETWLSKGKIQLLQLTGYNLASSFSRHNYEGGGVCILLKDGLEYFERKDIVDISVEFILEISAVDIPVLNLLLIVLYWPNSERETEVFYSSLEKVLNKTITNYKSRNVVIGGDFNVDVLSHSKKANTLINLMLNFNFRQLVQQPTRISKTSSTCIDLIFTNFSVLSKNNKNYLTIRDYGFSDHCGVTLTIPGLSSKQRHVWYTEKRLFNDKNITNYKTKIQNIDWNDIIKIDSNINENFKSFNQVLIDTLNQSIPKQRIKIKKYKNKGWLTTGIKKSCHHKRLYKIFVHQADSKILKHHYKIYEKTLKKIVNKSKKLDYISKIKKSNNIVKTMWHIIKQRTNKIIAKPKQNIKLKIHNNLTDDPIKVANSFSEFFASVGGTVGTGTHAQPRGRPVQSPTDSTLYLRPTDAREVFYIIRNLKSKRSFGFDELPPILIKRCAEELAWPYSLLINQSFEEGTFPEMLKKSIIKPVHKKGDTSDASNYRPIALLSTSSKIFETAMCKRLYSFCEKFSILDKSQNGFRKKRSTVLAVYKYMQEVLNILNDKKYAIGILLDMSKAYDKVSYPILLNKLYGIGVRGLSYDWFASYLRDREQLVQIENYNLQTGLIQNYESDSKIMNSSIPQGSVVGCLLFLIYINDLPKIFDELCILFADDISILFPYQPNCHSLNHDLNSILSKVVLWLEDHNLQINFTKTKIMQFRPRQRQQLEIDFSFNNTKLECVNSFTLLGLDIDTNVNWKSHIQKIKSKLSSFTYALTELKKTTNIATALSAYYAYAHAWLQYGIILWGNSTDADDLFILQKKCIRILVNIDSTESCKPHFIEHQILTLISIYILETSKFVRKYPQFFTKFQDAHTTSLNLRHKNRLALPSSKLKMHSTSANVMCIKIYNHIPKYLTDIEKESTFIHKLKQHLHKKCYYYLQDFFNDKNKT